MKIQFMPQGVCCQVMEVEIENNKVKSATFYGGCHGNSQGIGKLVAGMDVNEVIERLQGIKCGGKDTSCPDQLAKGLVAYLEHSKINA